MGNKLFGVDIAGELARQLGPLLLPLQLTKVLAGNRDPADLSSGTHSTTRRFTCRGIVESYKDSQIDGTIVLKGDRKVLILGDTLPPGVVPEPNDKVQAEQSSLTVVSVERDPDAAAYSCQAR